MNFFHGAPRADPRRQWVGVTLFPYKEECSNEGGSALFNGIYTEAGTAKCAQAPKNTGCFNSYTTADQVCVLFSF